MTAVAADVSEDVEAALLAHPDVARLDGAVASYLPGRRVDGVRVGAGRWGRLCQHIEHGRVIRIQFRGSAPRGGFHGRGLGATARGTRAGPP